MSYVTWLGGITIAFTVLERLFPWRRDQPFLRRELLGDLGWLVVNGHLFNVATAGLTAWTALRAGELLRPLGLLPSTPLLAGSSLAVQFVTLLVVSDLVQWCVHNLLHRVPWLWTFHKLHHSAEALDFVVNFRFHWMEILVYRAGLWLPLLWLGASGPAAFAVAVFGTVWGDFNHSNLNVSLGPLGRVFNNPRMHLWHHDISDEGGAAKNFGIVFSLWDFVFGTAFWPRDRSPVRLGYPGMEEMPRRFPGQLVWPLGRAVAAPER
jgi:sterol desaturase/sphingolipid hydroxylase (fatty acid hydroxylase superfamily)